MTGMMVLPGGGGGYQNDYNSGYNDAGPAANQGGGFVANKGPGVSNGRYCWIRVRVTLGLSFSDIAILGNTRSWWRKDKGGHCIPFDAKAAERTGHVEWE